MQQPLYHEHVHTTITKVSAADQETTVLVYEEEKRLFALAR